MAKIKVVLDTNTLVSAVGWEGKPGEIFEMCIRGEISLISSPALIDEFKTIIYRPKFDFIPSNEKEIFISLLMELSTITIPERRLEIILDDPKDNHILECALAGNADYIISGDRHLLKLKSFRTVKIVNSSDFLEIIRC